MTPESTLVAEAPRTTEAAPDVSRAERAALGRDRALEALFRKQHADGHWCAELEGDSILNTEYLLMKVILGQHEAPEATPEDLERFRKMLVYVRDLQQEDGTWRMYPGARSVDLSATVKAYFVLKLFGDDPDAPHMRRARERVLELGGAERINTFSNFYLACLGQVSWDACPSIPPEIAVLPRWFPFHMTKVSAWTRTMILPLAICTARRPVRRLPSNIGIGELFVDQSKRDRLTPAERDPDPVGWSNLFLGVDRLLKIAQRLGITPGRGAALAAAERWINERMTPETTDGLGAIFPPMVYVQIAFQALGYDRSHPVIANAEKELDRFFVEEEDHLRIQPCFSPVWDTGTALYAATEAGVRTHNDERIARVCEWLCEREVSMVGDWIDNLRPRDRKITMGPGGGTGPDAAGAWSFEYRNDWYPDVDDTAMVAKALTRAVRGAPADDPVARRARAAATRSVRWIRAMQNDDGGWAAFDRTQRREWMEHVPFADHNAMQDPSCADITGRTIESLVTNGVDADDPMITAAIDYLRREQKPDGSWWGRWGVNHIYGTWQAIGGLAAAGEDIDQRYLRRALEWLRSIQNDDGGFGESADSYEATSTVGQGPSTASQTAWAVISMMNLLPADKVAGDAACGRAVDYLLDTQLTEDMPAETTGGHGRHILFEPAGSWRETWFTGTGFPKVFYLRYHMYRHYFPLMALARYAQLAGEVVPPTRGRS
jgi:squalene-hopene/tetraprenyl-beta-curcumene cyclase